MVNNNKLKPYLLYLQIKETLP